MKIALVGNPNSGKSSLFNVLTGLNQKVGNFAGVTVEKKVGVFQLDSQTEAQLIDLPGTYSIYPKSIDEEKALEVLLDKNNSHYPQKVIVVADSSNLQRNLLLFTQIQDLGFPTILVLNMWDVAQKMGISYDLEYLKLAFACPVLTLNSRTGQGVEQLKEFINLPTEAKKNSFWEMPLFFQKNSYHDLVNALQNKEFFGENTEIKSILEEKKIDKISLQSQEINQRYQKIRLIVAKASQKIAKKQSVSQQLDAIFLHPIWGYASFLAVLFLIFQAIFTWASYPMDFIDGTFADLGNWLKTTLPPSALTDLLADGIVAGIGGIVIFVPQIAILSFFIALLEESGYMARVMFMMDKFMRKFGLNGKSIVPLISGTACAIPAIIASRSISNPKERLLTILVTPLMSCSARLPIYTIIIALVVPNQLFLGVFNLQGIVLMAMYLLGTVAALVSAWLINKFLKINQKSYFIMELPKYQVPRWQNIGITIWQKSYSFISEAGKVIMAISIVLWVLASYAPAGQMEKAEQQTRQQYQNLPENLLENKIAAAKLEVSYAGHLGKSIEPLICPLGYDWKIGIALISSFAAREVFVGTMATIYSLGDSEDSETVKVRMAKETNTDGKPFYNLALGASLLIFYAFAMQCMSTLAVVYKETQSWKYVFFQFVYMTALAYIGAWLAYNLLS